MKKIFAEFKKFAFKGNVIDMAVGVVIGAAFGKIVTSLVNDIIMPLIGLMIGNISFADLKWVFTPAVMENGEIVKAENALLYGSFLQNIVDFLIIAVSIFVTIKIFNKLLNKKKEPDQPKKPTEAELLTEIRDLMKEKKAQV